VIQPHRMPDGLDRIPVTPVCRHNGRSSQHHSRQTT
jgi:hypothetical protein